MNSKPHHWAEDRLHQTDRSWCLVHRLMSVFHTIIQRRLHTHTTHQGDMSLPTLVCPLEKRCWKHTATETEVNMTRRTVGRDICLSHPRASCWATGLFHITLG